MVASLVEPRGGDGPVAHAQDAGHAVLAVRVSDADAPRTAGFRLPDGEEVTARDDLEVAGARQAEDCARLVD